MTQVSQAPASTRAQIKEATLRKDPWWRQPAITGAALAVVVIVPDLGIPGQRGLLLEAVHLAAVLPLPGHHLHQRRPGSTGSRG